MASPTKADLLARIATMEAAAAAPTEPPVDALVRAIAALVADPDTARDIKHLFYRKDGDALIHVSLDMHEGGE